MAAIVTCKYCKEKFDRDKEPFIQIPHGQTFRYGHETCYLKAVENNEETDIYKVWNPKNTTMCFWCHKAIFKDQKDVIPMPQLKDRFIHIACGEKHPADDKEELTLYLIKLFKLKDDYILPKYMKQLTQYKTEYNYTYTGMLKTLMYWYDVKNHEVDLNRGLGIIPWHYKEAYDYYQALWQADQENSKKNFKEYVPQEYTIKISPPKRQPLEHRLFSFLDEDDINGE